MLYCEKYAKKEQMLKQYHTVVSNGLKQATFNPTNG
jgi:hypothetical protein